MQLENMILYSIQIVFNDTPTGSFKLQSSCDPVTAANLVMGANGVVTYVPTNWTDIMNSTFSITTSGNVQWNVRDIGYNYVRVVYTDGSGGTSTSVITSAIFNGKGI